MIPEKDSLRGEDGQVSFRYRNGKTGKTGKTGQTAGRTVPGATFLCLLVQHVLPRGFRRARNVGFLPPNRQRLIALLPIV